MLPKPQMWITGLRSEETEVQLGLNPGDRLHPPAKWGMRGVRHVRKRGFVLAVW